MAFFLRTTCSFFLKSVFFGLIILLSANTSEAAITWTGGFLGLGTQWNTASNWSTNSVPTSTDDVVFNDVVLGFTVNMTSNVTVKSITVNGVVSLLGAVVINNGGFNLTVTNLTSVGITSVILPVAITFSGSGTVTFNTAVTIYGSGTLTISSGTPATISGAAVITNDNGVISNAGTLTTSTSTFNFSGYNAGISNTSTGTVKANSSVFNASGQLSGIVNAGTFNLGTASIINVTGTSARVNNTGTFTLLSDATGSASIGPIASGATGFTGTYKVQRQLVGGSTMSGGRYIYRGYRLMSSPVNAGVVSGKTAYTLDYLSASAIITGAKSSNGTLGGNPTVYVYSEDYTFSNASFTGGNFKGVTDLTNLTSPYTMPITSNGSKTMYVGNAIMFFFRGDKTHNVGTSPGKTTYPYVAPESVVFTATGNLNQGSYTFYHWQTGTGPEYTTVTTPAPGNASIMGFNLVGNPYACTIDWQTVNTGGIVIQNVDPTIYAFNPRTQQYDTYSYTTSTGNNVAEFTGKIASGQGFFIRANNSNPLVSPSLVFNETAKSSASQLTQAAGTLMMGTPVAQTDVKKLLRLRLEIDSLNYDDMVVGFKSSASAKYDVWEDSQYLAGNGAYEGVCSFSADAVPLAVNFLPLPKQTADTIRLSVAAVNSGQMTFYRTQLDSLPKIYQLWLVDKYKKDSLDLRNNATYAFDVDKTDTTSLGRNRFELVIRQNPQWNIHLLSFTASKVSKGVEVDWKTENEENYTNFSVERSTDNGITFNVLGGFASNGQRTYNFTDVSPANAVNIYRLKIEDLNGTITYSQPVAIAYGTASQIATVPNINVYPNPAAGAINVAIHQPGANFLLSGVQGAAQPALTNASAASYSIKIISVSGGVIKTAQSSQPEWRDDVSTLSPGTYILQVTNNKDKSLVGKSTFVKL